MSLCTRDDITMINKCNQSMTMSSYHIKKNFRVNTFHGRLKAWMDLYHHCVCPGSYLKSAFLIYKAKLWQSIQGIPWRLWCCLICIITHGLCSTMHCFSMMISRQSRSPIGREGKSQTTHGSIAVEWGTMHTHRADLIKNATIWLAENVNQVS